ncbi:MAG: hypothetical protein DIU69_11900, partial [Bacillota bacterium]
MRSESDEKRPTAPASGEGAGPGRSTGRGGRRERPGPWRWRLAAAAAGVALCGGLMLVLPVPDDAGRGPGRVGVGPTRGVAGRPPVFVLVIEEEPGEWPDVIGVEAGEKAGPEGLAPLPPRGWAGERRLPAHTRTRP